MTMDVAPAVAAPGETALEVLLSCLRPRLHDTPCEFIHVATGADARDCGDAVMMFREDEGVTYIVNAPHAAKATHANRPLWAQITLDVQSSLSAVGLMAAVSSALAAHRIPCNPVSAFLHDHLFVPWTMRDEAMQALSELTNEMTC